MANTVKCSKGHGNSLGDNFCRICGERIQGGEIICPYCHAKNDSSANFCRACGESLQDRDRKFEGMRWQRNIDDFATRIDVEDLEGTLRKGIIVEQGTKAILLIDGALAEILQPGKHFFGGLIDNLKNFDLTKTGTAILVDAGDVELNLNLTNIFTKDPLNIDVTCKVIAQIENPTFFFNNVMKGRKSYLVSELRSVLYDEMHNALSEVTGKRSVTELNNDLSLKRQFEVAVENHLRTTFQRNGIGFIQLRTVDYLFKRFDEIRGIHEETFLQISEDEAKLQKRKRLFDVYDQTQLQSIIEETKEVEYREKRNKVWADMRQLVNSDKMNEIKSADDLEGYLHEINKGKYLREDEVQELLNVFKQSGLKREFLLKKIDLEQNLELERISLVGHNENELAAFEVEAKKKQRILEEHLLHKAAERGVKVEDAKADATIKDLEREGDRKDIDMGLDALERMKRMKAQEKRAEMEIETERLERLSRMGVEALISASGEEQAKILAELKKTEILKGMSEEQILAMGAKDSPELAKAFQEKFKGLSAEEQKKLYERMMTDRDKMHGDTMKMVQEMFNKALETQRDVSVEAAKSSRPSVIYPPPGSGFVGPGGIGGTGFYNVSMDAGGKGPEVEVIICQKCRSKVPTGQKFCNNCGNEMF